METPPVPLHHAEFRRERYGPRERVSIPRDSLAPEATKLPARPGDFILTHSSGFYGTMIRIGEAILYRGSDSVFAHWSHAAIFVDESGNIIEALGGGVQQRNISVYDDTEYVVVHLPENTIPLDRQHAVKFADFCIHDPYGWLTIVGIAFCLLTGARVSIGMDGQQICSALVARCLERIGEIFPERDPWQIVPADLAKHFNVLLIGDKGEVPSQETGVSAFSKPGGRRR